MNQPTLNQVASGLPDEAALCIFCGWEAFPLDKKSQFNAIIYGENLVTSIRAGNDSGSYELDVMVPINRKSRSDAANIGSGKVEKIKQSLSTSIINDLLEEIKSDYAKCNDRHYDQTAEPGEFQVPPLFGAGL